MTLELPFPITPPQLRRLHVLWRDWAGNLNLSPAQNRRLRHYYVELFSNGHALATNLLTQTDAAKVIAWLERLTAPALPKQDVAAGTAGRHGYPERRRIPPNAEAWAALWACTRELGWDRLVLEDFIRTHYQKAGLHGLNDLHTMADLNRVLWGVKAILRRRPQQRKHHQHAA